MVYRYLEAPHSDTAVCCNQSERRERWPGGITPTRHGPSNLESGPTAQGRRGVIARRPRACFLENCNHDFDIIFIGVLVR